MSSRLAQFLFCVLSVLLCSEICMAQDFDSAMRAYEKGEYATALTEFTAVAEQGNQEAQLIVGKMYMIGQEVEKDSEQAIHWFKAAAGQGNTDAQFFLGAIYLLPQRDIAEGLKWLAFRGPGNARCSVPPRHGLLEGSEFHARPRPGVYVASSPW